MTNNLFTKIFRTAASELEQANNTHLTLATTGCAAKSYDAHGVMRQTVHYLIRNCWNLNISDNPELNMRDIIPVQCLLYWNPMHFLQQLTTDANGSPVIIRNNVAYHVLYVKGTGPANIRTFGQLALSFRSAHNDYMLPAYVLVSGSTRKVRTN